METDINLFEIEEGRFCLTITDTDDKTYELFNKLGLQGGGYTWEGIVKALVKLHMSDSLSTLEIGAEADNMYVYSSHKESLKILASLIQKMCNDHTLLSGVIAQANDEIE